MKFVSPLATCALAFPQWVSYFSFLHNFTILTKSVMSDMKFVFSLSPLATCELVHSLMLRR